MTGPKGESEFSVFMVSTVEDGEFGIRRDAAQGGLGLKADVSIKAGGELAHRTVDNDDRRAFIDAEHTAQPAVEANDIARAEPERRTCRRPPDHGKQLGLGGVG